MPTAAKGFVKRDHCQELIPFSAGQIDLRWEELLLGFEDFVVTGFTGKVALSRDVDCGVQGLHFAGLLLADFRRFLARVERDQLLAIVRLYKALGGGWDMDQSSRATP